MQILQVVDALPAATYGGTELYTTWLAAELADDHDVAVATPRGAETPIDGATVHALPDTGDWVDPTGAASGLERELVDERVEAAFLDLLDAIAPDVVHFQHLQFTSTRLPELCQRRDVASVLTLHDFWTTCHRATLQRPDGRNCDGPESLLKCAACYADALERNDYRDGDPDPTVDGGAGSAGDGAGSASDGARSASSEDGPEPAYGDRGTEPADPSIDPPEPTPVEDPAASGTDRGPERAGDGTTGPGGSKTVDPDDVRDDVARRAARLEAARAETDLLISPSAFLRSRFVEFGTPRERIVHCRNGVRTDEYLDTGFDPADGIAIGYAGRITHAKGVHVLVEVFGTVQGDAELHVFGAFDPETDRYHARLADAAGDRVQFHGQYEDNGAPFRAVDVLVMPSLPLEDSPLVIQEAFAAGVPVVVGDAGGSAELVQHGHDGLTYPVGDPVALAESLQALVDDPQSVQRLRAGIESPKSLADHAREVEFLYEVCLEGDSPPVADADLP